VSSQTERDVPLAPHAFHVLLALERESLHGYAIMKQVQETADSLVGPGAVYGALQRLEAAGLVREGRRLDPERGSRPRQEYEITQAGLAALRGEARRLARLVRLASERDLVPEEGPS